MIKKFLLFLIVVFLWSQFQSITFAATSVGGGQDFHWVIHTYKWTWGSTWTHRITSAWGSVIRLTISSYHKLLTPDRISKDYTLNFKSIAIWECVLKPFYSLRTWADGTSKFKSELEFCRAWKTSLEVKHITFKLQSDWSWEKRGPQSHNVINISKLFFRTSTRWVRSTQTQSWTRWVRSTQTQSWNDSWSAELSLPFTSVSICTTKRDFNNKEYPDYIRSSCFSKSNKYYYTQKKLVFPIFFFFWERNILCP